MGLSWDLKRATRGYLTEQEVPGLEGWLRGGRGAGMRQGEAWHVEGSQQQAPDGWMACTNRCWSRTVLGYAEGNYSSGRIAGTAGVGRGCASWRCLWNEERHAGLRDATSLHALQCMGNEYYVLSGRCVVVNADQ